MKHLVVAALWSETAEATAATDAVADLLRPLKQEGSPGLVVSFPADHPEMDDILRVLRRFDMAEMADYRPEVSA